MALSYSLLLGQCRQLERERDAALARVDELEEEVAVLKTRMRSREGHAAPLRPSEEELRRRYWEERETLGELGTRYHVTYRTVGRWLEEAGIPRRTRSLAQQTSLGDRGRSLKTSAPPWRREGER